MSDIKLKVTAVSCKFEDNGLMVLDSRELRINREKTKAPEEKLQGADDLIV